MSIVLFALIGAALHANTAYWICFSLYCGFRLVKIFMDIKKDMEDKP